MGKITTINFHDDTLFAVERDDGVYVAAKPVCDALGLNWKSQYNRMCRDAILSEGMVIMTMPSVGGAQETVCLKLETVNGWLFTIDENRVKDEDTRQKVLRYKRECYQVLFDHFYGKGNNYAEVLEDIETPENTKLRMVTEARHTYGAQVASELWLMLGLPITPSMIGSAKQLSFIDFRSRLDAKQVRQSIR